MSKITLDVLECTPDYNGLTRGFIESRTGYDILVLDNDAFLVDKNPALDNLAALTEFVDRARIVVTAALPTQDLLNRVNTLGVRFAEKGKWKSLEGTISDAADNYRTSTRSVA